MKPQWKHWAIRVIKFTLALFVLAFIGWQFARDLRRLDTDRLEWRPGWLVACGLTYLIALMSAGWFWWRLHRLFGYPISFYAANRAHYIGQLGKYVPGKALAVLIRANLVHPLRVPYGVSIIASFYEVFTGMAAGAIVAAMIYLIDPPTVSGVAWHPLWLGVGLIALCGLPLLPGVFNFIVGRLAARLQTIENYRLPPVRLGTLSAGLAVSAVGWCAQGLSWWMMLQAVLPEPPPLTLDWWLRCTASIAFANVAGFVIVVVPTGLGVREYLLLLLLQPAVAPDAEPFLAAAAVLLRLDWITAEALFALCTYWIQPKPRDERSDSRGSSPTVTT